MDTEFKMPGVLLAKPSRKSEESESSNILKTLLSSESNDERKEIQDNPVPSDPPDSTISNSNTTPVPVNTNKTQSLAEKQAKYAEILASLKYHPPENGASAADPRYSFEVLKTGTIVDQVKFRRMDNKGFYVVGRVPACDIIAENPTVSRTHAILQFVQCPDNSKKSKSGNKKEADTGLPTSSGLYVFDLNSTHGTFINKNQIFPNRYYRLHVGHVLKFGNSTRLYVLNGPEDDEEEESGKSVTELQNEKLQKELERKRLESELDEQGLLIKSAGSGEEGADGCSWGMAEDAEEESDQRVNPFAINFEESESFDNPKRTLRGWFEREGYDLVYDCREKATGQFICRINLPVDGPGGQPVFAEVDVKGKKKEAVLQAALQACQILDKYGVLRQSHHESKSKRKERDWEDKDYYSSDEDTFLDRTGSVEKKREKRMKTAGKIEETVETYESLCKKAQNLQADIDAFQFQISQAQNMDSGEDVDLDDYVKLLKTGVTDIKKLKSKLREASEELKRINKLIQIAKPAVLPFNLVETKTELKADTKTEINTPHPPQKLNSPIESGKNILLSETKSGLVDDHKHDNALPKPKEDLSNKGTTKQPKLFGPRFPGKPPNIPEGASPVVKKSHVASASTVGEAESDEEIETGNLNKSKDDSDSSDNEAEPSKSTSEENPSKKKRRNRQRQKINKDAKFDYDDSDPKYSTWVPPTDQRGDGKTALNEKLGY